MIPGTTDCIRDKGKFFTFTDNVTVNPVLKFREYQWLATVSRPGRMKIQFGISSARHSPLSFVRFTSNDQRKNSGKEISEITGE